MRERSRVRNGVWRAKQIVAASCGVLAVLVIAGTTFLLWEAFFACGDPRHGCGYVRLGGMVMLVIGIACLAMAYMFWPTRPTHEGSDRSF